MGWRLNEKVFWSRVKKGNGCWTYNGVVTKDGYGRLRYEGVKVLAHRLAYILSNKVEIPEGMCVLHSCDNRICVNPKHLFLGTHSDNMKDMKQKGRRKGFLLGEMSPKAKFTDTEVLRIRAEYAAGIKDQMVLSVEYGVSQPCISAIVLRKTWKHLP